MKLRTIVITICGTVIGVCLCVVALAWLVTRDLCGNVLLSQAVSPDGRLKAVVYRRDCGATTGFSVHVSILNSWETLTNDNAANIYGQDEKNYGPVTVRWDGDHVLSVAHAREAKPFLSVKEIWVLPLFQEVRIKYELRGNQ